jgi:hypothetical protein
MNYSDMNYAIDEAIRVLEEDKKLMAEVLDTLVELNKELENILKGKE